MGRKALVFNPTNNYKLHRSVRERNFILLTDAYKITHHFQYPPDVGVVYSYMEPRVGAQYDDIVWFGLQYILKHYKFVDTAISREMIDEAVGVCNEVFGHPFLNEEGWNYILNTYHGQLPLRIYALPEGTIVKPGTPVMAIENTDPNVPWLTNYVESLLMHVYASTNTATISYDCYKTIKKYDDIAGEAVSPFHLNDFGLRGASSLTSAELCGLGHLAIFAGTDNIPAIEKARWYYNSGVCGGSVIAAEHSTITAWGQDNECAAYRNIIEKADEVYGNDTVISLVIDSYNWENAVERYFCDELVGLIKNRAGKIVLRPDSGVPWLVTRQILNMLWNTYGGTINEKGYKVLDPHVGVIYGDGINAQSIDKILSLALQAGFSPSNVIFGSGGYILQQHNRDTLRFAIKCSEVTKKDGTRIPIHKTTIGKESKAGRFDLPLVYEHGKLLIDEEFNTIRERIRMR